MMNTSDEKKQGSRVGWKIKTPEEHVARIVAWFTEVVTVKYRTGQEEHGGDLWNKPRALAHLEEELIALPVYYKPAKDQLRQMAYEGKSAKDAYEHLYGEPLP